MEDKSLKNQQLIDNLEAKISVLKDLQTKETSIYKGGKIQGMIEGFEYSLEHIKNLPIWIPTIEKILHVIIGFCVGYIVSLFIHLY